MRSKKERKRELIRLMNETAGMPTFLAGNPSNRVRTIAGERYMIPFINSKRFPIFKPFVIIVTWLYVLWKLVLFTLMSKRRAPKWFM